MGLNNKSKDDVLNQEELLKLLEGLNTTKEYERVYSVLARKAKIGEELEFIIDGKSYKHVITEPSVIIRHKDLNEYSMSIKSFENVFGGGLTNEYQSFNNPQKIKAVEYKGPTIHFWDGSEALHKVESGDFLNITKRDKIFKIGKHVCIQFFQPNSISTKINNKLNKKNINIWLDKLEVGKKQNLENK